MGGVWTFVKSLAVELAATGTEVQLATFGPESTAVHPKELLSSHLAWRHFDCKLEWMENPWSDLAQAREWLLDLSREFQPDLIHLNTLCHGDAPFNCPVLLTVHSCVPSWWAAVQSDPLPATWSTYKQQVSQSIAGASVLTVPSKAMASDFSASFSLNTTPLQPIYNGCSDSVFAPTVKQPMILSVGRLWDEAKNVKALASVSNHLSWPVYLVGERGASHANCHSLGHMPTDQLAGWYARAAIYCLPAKYEPFGLSVLEAALSECALVLGDIPSLREIWGDAAVYVPPDDLAKIEEVIHALISNPDYRQKMGVRAKLHAARYSLGQMIRGYRSAYIESCKVFANKHRSLACAS